MKPLIHKNVSCLKKGHYGLIGFSLVVDNRAESTITVTDLAKKPKPVFNWSTVHLWICEAKFKKNKDINHFKQQKP